MKVVHTYCGALSHTIVAASRSEALGQLGQDEPASGMALESLVAFARFVFLSASAPRQPSVISSRDPHLKPVVI